MQISKVSVKSPHTRKLQAKISLGLEPQNYTLQSAGAFQGSKSRAFCDWSKSISVAEDRSQVR